VSRPAEQGTRGRSGTPGRSGRPQLSPTDIRRLLAAARAVRLRAHAPYSHFQVGAAVLDERDRIHVGCNVENASYGLTVCAERNAVATAIAAGALKIRAVAVVTSADPPASPCGACRQVLSEFSDNDAPVLMAGPRGQAHVKLTVAELLPAAFSL
jgi:cytidine deaminase